MNPPAGTQLMRMLDLVNQQAAEIKKLRTEINGLELINELNLSHLEALQAIHTLDKDAS